MNSKVPHLRIIIVFCGMAIGGYAAFSIWAVAYSGDPTLLGDVGGTWKSFAVAAFAFWLGSSSGGKASPTEPMETKVVNPPDDPVQTEAV